MLRLYELPEAFRALEDEIDAANGEMTQDMEARLDALELSLEVKVDAIAALARAADAEDVAIDNEIKALSHRRNAARHRAYRLKTYLYDTLKRLDRDHVNGQRFKVRIQPNGQPSIRWAGPGPIPIPFRRVVEELDGRAALEAHRAGVLPAGFEVHRGEHLRIS